ncbi:MAG: hypothetical protein Q9M92_06230, partial [Enterobacterales bacterium]|nr:hypothetical protein [Enterobacterales bacterium]
LFGKPFDFNLGNRKKCTIQDWQNGHKITKSYDQYFGKLYDSNSDGYIFATRTYDGNFYDAVW